MEEKPVRKTTVKKTVRRVATKKVPARTVTAERKPAPVSSTRKAPVRAAAVVPQRSKKSLRVFVLGLVLFSILLGVSALIGFSDKGELDVAGKIAERKQHATGEEQTALETVTTGSPQNVPTASLVGMGDDPGAVVPEPVLPIATTTPETASSSEAVATTTPEVNQTEQVAGESVDTQEPESL